MSEDLTIGPSPADVGVLRRMSDEPRLLGPDVKRYLGSSYKSDLRTAVQTNNLSFESVRKGQVIGVQYRYIHSPGQLESSVHRSRYPHVLLIYGPNTWVLSGVAFYYSRSLIS